MSADQIVGTITGLLVGAVLVWVFAEWWLRRTLAKHSSWLVVIARDGHEMILEFDATTAPEVIVAKGREVEELYWHNVQQLRDMLGGDL